jgi:hypothetical protein
VNDSQNSPANPWDAPDYDPAAFLAGLTFDPSDAPLDMPVPPRLREDEVITVRRTVDLDPGVDASLRAAAAARGISVEELIQERARHAA